MLRTRMVLALPIGVVAGGCLLLSLAGAADAPKAAASTSGSASASASAAASVGGAAGAASEDEGGAGIPPPIGESAAAASTETPAEVAGSSVNSDLPPENKPAGDGLPHAAWHPSYAAEIEPHFVVAGLDKFSAGVGLGLNITIPIWQHSPFSRIDDDISFGLGLDWVRYAAYVPTGLDSGRKVTTQAIYVPVFVQWNIWAGARAAFFLEPTLLYRFASYSDTCGAGSSVPCADKTRLLPTGSIGLRFRISDRIAGTMRVGWPMFTLGASWL